ncbi:MAG: hypothetical protein KAR20_19940 [Candidatus Heimdallarchaeota archaeon]|nr:hypothetical protein [Candidatus Heimdallarchaeota archaeon]
MWKKIIKVHFKNDHLEPLMPHYLKGVENSLDCIKKGIEYYDSDIIAFYATEVLDRVCEIDRVFEGLKLSIEYLDKKEFGGSEFEFTSHHSFHVENFILRLTGITDRCWLLVGSSLLFEKKSIEKLQGKSKIKKAIQVFPHIEESIDVIESIVMKFRKDRNDIAHNCGYKNNNLFVLAAINNFDLEVDDMLGANQYVIDEAVGLLHPVIDELNIAITNLISSLSFLYKRILEHKGNNT